jgi:hypothetical protein
MTMILLSHGTHEFSNHPEMRNSVHFERFHNASFIGVEYGRAATYTGIVDQNRWIPVILSDLCCCRGNLGNGSNV